MKKPITFAAVLDRLIWMIGLVTILNYTQDHWPTVYFVAACVLGVSFGLWFFYKFFLLPFRNGLLGR